MLNSCFAGKPQSICTESKLTRLIFRIKRSSSRDFCHNNWSKYTSANLGDFSSKARSWLVLAWFLKLSFHSADTRRTNIFKTTWALDLFRRAKQPRSKKAGFEVGFKKVRLLFVEVSLCRIEIDAKFLRNQDRSNFKKLRAAGVEGCFKACEWSVSIEFCLV